MTFHTKQHFTVHLTSSVHQLTSIKPKKEVSKDKKKTPLVITAERA